MPFLELFALATGVALWSEGWSRKKILVVTDCEPVKKALNKGTTHSPEIAALLRFVMLQACLYNFEIRATHIAGVDNVWSDRLSRGQIQEFLALSRLSPSSRVTNLPGVKMLTY